MGGFEPIQEDLEAFFSCANATRSKSDLHCSAVVEHQELCKTVVLVDSNYAACVPLGATFTQTDADGLDVLLRQYLNFDDFIGRCPWSSTLERSAARQSVAAGTPEDESCESGWITLVDVVGCEQCRADRDFFHGEVSRICSKHRRADICQSRLTTAAVEATTCEHLGTDACQLLGTPLPRYNDNGAPEVASGLDEPVEDDEGQTHAPASSHAAENEDDPPLSTAAIVGIAAAVVTVAVLIAVAAAAYIIRGPPRRGTKKPAALHPTTVNTPGAEAAAAPAGIYMPPPPGHAGGPPPGPPAGPPAGAPPMGRPPQLFIPPDMFQSARQYMASGGAQPSSGACPSYLAAAPSSGGAAGASQIGGQYLRRSSTEIGRLPARDVMVQQTRRLGGSDAQGQDPEFSILTRAAWDCTVAGSTPPPHIVPDRSVLPEEVLEAQIDYLLNQGQGDILPDLRLAPMLPQRIGQRGAVIFVQQRDDPTQLCAVKFFFEWADFDREAAATRNPDLAAAMPPVKAVHGHPAARSTADLPPPLSSYPLPPALVTSKGESLDEHTARTSPDFVSSLSIMIHITTVVGRLHDAGWVHRDLKPTNAVFLPQQARWALVDFGCAARRGDRADISFSLYYAPPEVIQAYRAGDDQVIATEAADVWALGVIAWELFTKRKFYGPAPDFAWVVRVLMGEEPLPSEVPLLPEVRERLGNSRFRNVFLSMLARDPAQRPSVAQLLTSWNSVFSQTTSL